MCGGRVLIVTCCVAIMAIITPTPRQAWTPANSQKPQSLLTPWAMYMPQPASRKPRHIGTRGSVLRTSRPAIGPVRNIDRPETIIVVPTSDAE